MCYVAVRVMSDVYEESDHMMPARTDTFLSPSLSGGRPGQAGTVDTAFIIIWSKIVFDIGISQLGQGLIKEEYNIILVSGPGQ